MQKRTEIIVEDPFAADFHSLPASAPSSSCTISMDIRTTIHASDEEPPNLPVDEIEEGGLGVVVDGANIGTTYILSSVRVPSTASQISLISSGWSYGKSSFSAEGLLLALDFLSSLGNVRSVCFLPASYARKRPSDGTSGNALMETEALETLNLLIGSSRIILVPPDSHDDLFILSYG